MPDEQSPRLLRALRHRTGRADARASHVLLYMGDRASSLGHSHLFDLPLPSRGCLLETGLAVTGEKYESGDRRPPSGCPELKRLDHVGRTTFGAASSAPKPGVRIRTRRQSADRTIRAHRSCCARAMTPIS